MQFRQAFTTALVTLLVAAPLFSAQAAAESDCKLSYPLVMSHHFGIRKICPDDWTVGECARREAKAVEKYCEAWDDETGCQQWSLPPEEQHLPPRAVNAQDPELVRTSDIYSYHRYFSHEIVESLEACGNEVFLSDKPVYASYELRAKSLRSTVLDALEETGADKVIIIGHSQGVQDARLMTAALPVNDEDPGQGTMNDKVAAVVSLAGEQSGAESASLMLAATYATNYLAGEGWGDYEAGEATWNMVSGEEVTTDGLWRLKGDAETDEELAQHPLVLTEGYDPDDPNQFDLDTAAKYRNFMHAITNLSRQYMGGAVSLDPWSWDKLRDYIGMEESGWEDWVDAGNERCNGVEYISYAARIRRWDADNWGEGSTWYLMSTFYGPNDAYVTVDSQRFDRIGYWPCLGSWSNNFHHLKTLDGKLWGHGYHHMFFTGRNPFDAPREGSREEAPYDGDAADIFVQIARDLREVGF